MKLLAIFYNLRNRVLKCAIQPTVDKETVEQKAFCSRGNPEDSDEQRNEQKNLDKAERDTGQRRIPGQRNAGGIDRADRKKDQCCKTENRRNDRDEIVVDLEAAEETPDAAAL